MAAQVGFSDISYFNKLFRSRFGDTPKGIVRTNNIALTSKVPCSSLGSASTLVANFVINKCQSLSFSLNCGGLRTKII